ncbi:MAG: hypothetical protein ACI3VQ_08290 [Faecousia sp.]
MKNIKKALCILTLALLSLALLAGCGSSGDKLSDPDAIEAYGILIWDNKLIDVCFTHDQEKIYIYYDDGDYALFETVDLPVERFREGDNDWHISSVETDDLTANGYSDLYVYISHSDMSESAILWTWNPDKAYYLNQPTNSFFYRSKEDDQPGIDFSAYEGIWICDEDNQYENIFIAIDQEGYWQLYSGDELADEGYLYVLGDDGIYVYSYEEGILNGGHVEVEGDRLYIDNAGYFNYFSGLEG